jgi:hypothetical protein
VIVLTTLVVTATAVAMSASAVQAQTSPAVTVNPNGSFNRDGSATITGTFDCGNASGDTSIQVNLSQLVGRVSTVFGSAFADVPACTPGLTGTWTATIPPSNGQFKGGQARANAQLVVNGVGVAETGADVRLRHG